jgi:hypothetical protein
MGHRMKTIAAVMLCACALCVARAQDANAPGRAARLSDVEGTVSLQPAGMQDWTQAPLNRPLTTGDRLWSDQGSRAELDLGAAVIRLDSSTGFAFLDLDDTIAQMQVPAGTVIVRVSDLQANQIYEIDTPNLAVSVQQPGEYRVEVSPTGDATVVKVDEGAAQAAGSSGQTIAIGAGESLTASGTNTLAYESAPLGPPDDFDNWSAARDAQEQDSESAQYVAADVPGTQALDDNGTWQQTPDYGYVWTPATVVAGWAPYRFGRWAWVSPWGWTWIDDAPWGYAPFHYGRWMQCRNAWCWVPGPRGARPAYAPALVAWTTAAGSTPASRDVGWFPLAPGEAYGVARAHYANRLAAATRVPQDIFSSGQRVSGRLAHLPSAAPAAAALARPPAIAPIRQSVLGPSEGRGAVRPPAAMLRRTVTVRTAPPHALAAVLPVRLIKSGGPVVAATALPHRALTASLPPAMSLADRERILQHPRLGPAPVARATSAAPRPADPPAPPPQYLPPVPQSTFAADDPTHAYGHPSALPVYHPPVVVDDESAHEPLGESERASHPAPMGRAPQAPHAGSAKPSAKEPRASAAHADRDSRERVLR